MKDCQKKVGLQHKGHIDERFVRQAECCLCGFSITDTAQGESDVFEIARTGMFRVYSLCESRDTIDDFECFADDRMAF